MCKLSRLPVGCKRAGVLPRGHCSFNSLGTRADSCGAALGLGLVCMRLCQCLLLVRGARYAGDLRAVLSRDWAHCYPGYRFIGWDPANVSYWVALLFTLGSAAWIVNGWYLFLPTGNAMLDLNAAGWSGASL